LLSIRASLQQFELQQAGTQRRAIDQDDQDQLHGHGERKGAGKYIEQRYFRTVDSALDKAVRGLYTTIRTMWTSGFVALYDFVKARPGWPSATRKSTLTIERTENLTKHPGFSPKALPDYRIMKTHKRKMTSRPSNPANRSTLNQIEDAQDRRPHLYEKV
jgi:hypothetical protein